MKITNPYTSLIINGVFYNKITLLKLINQPTDTLPSWKKSFYSFLQDWLNEQDYVEVSTSGSTGTPKRIRLSKEKMVNSAKMTGEYFGFQKEQKALLCLPCHYIAGKMMVMRAMVWGWNLICVEPSGNPLATVAQSIDFAAMVPMQVTKAIAETPSKMSYVKQLIIGGGKVHHTLWQQLQLVSTKCFATYGMTETITHIAIQSLNGGLKTEAFQILPKVSITQDERACLVIEAPHLSDDKIVTNDIVQLVDPQQFIWLGRFDNVINTGGVKVFPEQIEKKLEALLKTRFFISYLPDNKLGQKVVLMIESLPWKEQKIADFQQKTNKILSKFELPKHLFFLPAFIETPTGKVQRSKTKSLL